ncbi:TolC family protein [Desertivirga arenae]|uniref:TolC family protein n=1 Tax=Desertivirga arenae TaxID=2810309 RepID=UPI001A962FF9|nr:TolC family protein [Pedobacter sp. SYSU D00823]
MKLTTWLNTLVRSIVFLTPAFSVGQELSLETVQFKARENFPLIRQQKLIEETENIGLQNLSKGYLPQLSFNGQATYQSEVTKVDIPVPGITVNSLSKDQYKATLDLNQTLFDGGIISNQKQLQKLNSDVEHQRIEVELHKLKERIQQIYLSILLLDEQTKQADLVKTDIKTGYEKTEALVKNGVAFRSNLNSLEAELLKADQRKIELQALRSGLVRTLGLFIAEPLPINVQLQRPNKIEVVSEVKRPELNLFDKQTSLAIQQKKLITSRTLPKASLFGQGGYGRPGLNMLQNQFDWFYIGGIRLNWNISNIYTYKKEKLLADINAKSTELQKETFLLNTNAQLTQQKAEIEKLELLIDTDRQIIELREKVKTAASAQLENQVISTSDYIREVNAEDQARQMLITHQLQLIQAQLTYSTIAGY